MRFRSALIVLVSCLVVGLAAQVWADDVLPPDWRGERNSTLQVWEFPNGANPAMPDVVANPYGDPLATIYGIFDFPLRDTWWIDDELQGHQGVWNVGGTIGLWIPNSPILREEKRIRLQITYDGGHAVDPGIPFDPWIVVQASDGAVQTGFQLVQKQAVDPVFTHAVYDIVLKPNPREEVIWIQPRYCQLYVDEIVVDTICVPEPAALVLVVMGLLGGLLVWRRKP